MKVLCCLLWFYSQYVTEDVIKHRRTRNLACTVVLNHMNSLLQY